MSLQKRIFTCGDPAPLFRDTHVPKPSSQEALILSIFKGLSSSRKFAIKLGYNKQVKSNSGFGIWVSRNNEIIDCPNPGLPGFNLVLRQTRESPGYKLAYWPFTSRMI